MSKRRQMVFVLLGATCVAMGCSMAEELDGELDSRAEADDAALGPEDPPSEAPGGVSLDGEAAGVASGQLFKETHGPLEVEGEKEGEGEGEAECSSGPEVGVPCQNEFDCSCGMVCSAAMFGYVGVRGGLCLPGCGAESPCLDPGSRCTATPTSEGQPSVSLCLPQGRIRSNEFAIKVFDNPENFPENDPWIGAILDNSDMEIDLPWSPSPKLGMTSIGYRLEGLPDTKGTTFSFSGVPVDSEQWQLDIFVPDSSWVVGELRHTEASPPPFSATLLKIRLGAPTEIEEIWLMAGAIESSVLTLDALGSVCSAETPSACPDSAAVRGSFDLSLIGMQAEMDFY